MDPEPVEKTRLATALVTRPRTWTGYAPSRWSCCAKNNREGRPQAPPTARRWGQRLPAPRARRYM